MLLEIKKYLANKEQANLQELAFHFKQQPEMIRCMMPHWVRKGKATMVAKPPGCGSKCFKCQPAAIETYRWVRKA